MCVSHVNDTERPLRVDTNMVQHKDTVIAMSTCMLRGRGEGAAVTFYLLFVAAASL